MMGYFIAMGRLGGNNVMQTWHPAVRTMSYTLLGILSAITFHGSYDFMIFYTEGDPGNLAMTLMILFGLAITVFMSSHVHKKLNA